MTSTDYSNKAIVPYRGPQDKNQGVAKSNLYYETNNKMNAHYSLRSFTQFLKNACEAIKEIEFAIDIYSDRDRQHMFTRLSAQDAFTNLQLLKEKTAELTSNNLVNKNQFNNSHLPGRIAQLEQKYQKAKDKDGLYLY